MDSGVLQRPSLWSHANTTTMRPPPYHHHHHHHHHHSAASNSTPPFLDPHHHHDHHHAHNLFSSSLPSSSSSSTTHYHHDSLPLPLSTYWMINNNDTQQHLPPLPPHSWSQLSLGGSAVDERKELEKWDDPQLPSHGYPTTTTKISKQPANIINSSSSSASSSSSYKVKLHSKLASTTTTAAAGGAPAKKPRVQQAAAASHQSISFKVRREKLGDRITALHQLVSPFGKTDTASVLLETIGYVRFLQSQIEALSLPYLATATPESHQQSMPLEHINKGDTCSLQSDLHSKVASK